MYYKMAPISAIEEHIPENYKESVNKAFNDYKGVYTWTVSYQTKKLGLERKIDDVFTYDEACKKAFKYENSEVYFKGGTYPILRHDAENGDRFNTILGMSFINHNIEYFIHPLVIESANTFYVESGDELMKFTVRSARDEIAEQIIDTIKRGSSAYIMDEVKQYFDICTKKYCNLPYGDCKKDFIESIHFHGTIDKVNDTRRLYTLDGPIIADNDFVYYQDALLQLKMNYDYFPGTRLVCINEE